MKEKDLEPLEKKIRDLVAAAAMSASAISPVVHHLHQSYGMGQQEQLAAPAAAPKFEGQDFGYHAASFFNRANKQKFDKQATLKAIAQQESSGGKNVHHRVLDHGINKGSHAYGKYGLTDSTIKETIKKNPELNKLHSKLHTMSPEGVHSYLQKHPDLEDQIASSYHDRLTHALGTAHPAAVYVGWLNGISGGKKYIQENDPLQHPIASKVHATYQKLVTPKKY